MPGLKLHPQLIGSTNFGTISVTTAPGTRYAGTHFDLFRIENGKIAEHWDPATKPAPR